MTAEAITQYLQDYPPFTYLSRVGLEELASQTTLRSIAEGDYLFEEGGQAEPFAYLLRKGRIEILKKFEDSTQVIDILKKGDLLGIRAILTNKPYLASARATRKSILLKIPAPILLDCMERYPRVALFFARGFAAGMPIIHVEEKEEKAKETHFLSRDPVLFMRTEDVLIPNPVEDLLKGPGETTLREVARQMQERLFGSFIIVDKESRPLGIATESDFIRRGSERNVNWESPVSEIMSSPVVAIRKGATAAQLIIAMSKYKVDHLVVTEDGTPQSPVLGIISQRDILLMHGNNPAVLVRQLREARDVKTLARIRNRADELIYNYLRQEVSIPFIAAVTTEINDTLLQKAFEFSLSRLQKEGLKKPPLSFCWLSLGSEGRGEQLRRTDQDNAIVYEDPPEGQEEQAERYFQRLGAAVADILLQCGFARCPGDIMASNPKWVKPLSGWKQQFSGWIEFPNSEGLIGVSIFFDFRPGYGDGRLTDALYDHIQQTIGERRSFLNFFAESALRHPSPTGFFGKFILENKDGKEGAFDLKARAMRPLDHAARVLAYANNIRGVTNTIQRYEQLEAILPDKKLFREASLAYEILLRYRAINGFRNEDSGRYIFPKQLTRIERKTLETCFAAVERVQQYLKNMFRVS
ncbi:MAG: CBS domain-containing protein [Phaeodactylibacter sp.]|nr:CBS domain-containing protein [Phaeodactylibacter sp.]